MSGTNFVPRQHPGVRAVLKVRESGAGGTKFTVFEFEWAFRADERRGRRIWAELLEQSLQFSISSGRFGRDRDDGGRARSGGFGTKFTVLDLNGPFDRPGIAGVELERHLRYD